MLIGIDCVKGNLKRKPLLRTETFCEAVSVQSVAAFIKQMSLACPNLALHEETLQLACAPASTSVPKAPGARGSDASSSKEQASVYDLTSGDKKFSLMPW